MKFVPFAIASVAFLAGVARADSEGDAYFESKVRPLLVERCLKCHGDEGKPKGGLKLTSKAAVLSGGDSGPAAVPGKPEESAIVQAVLYKDEPKMPPKAKLPDSEIAVVTKWIAMGMPWPETNGQVAAAGGKPFVITEEQRKHWAWQPVRPVATPPVKDGAWAADDIDRFILAKLEEKGLRPAPRADDRTWLRRVTFDLTGLPPTPEEIAAFLSDTTGERRERAVDRLLASPAYGERWARHWLDVVRYADSLDSRGSGQPGDILDAYRYRDWVVNALNVDMPYDKFVRYQVAGDVLPPADASEGDAGFNRAGTIATTMLAIGNWGNGDADKEKILTDIADDQVDVVSKAFLGVTLSCARCHHHKFDPFSNEDYYGMAGIFFSTHILPKLTPKGAGETIIRVPLDSPADARRRADYAAKLAELEAKVKAASEAEARAYAATLRPDAARYLVALADYRSLPGDKTTPMTDFAASRGLKPFALRQLAEYFGAGSYRTFDKKQENVGGMAGVFSWTAEGLASSVTANTNDAAKTILTFTLPARSVSVHPGPNSGVAITWTSPIAGTVRVSGSIADGDAACGDGVLWYVDQRSTSGLKTLASGDVANGASQPIARGKGADALGRLVVKPGDRIQLVVHPRGEYSCDTTAVEFVVSAWDGSAVWDLTRDVCDDFHAGNPHPDRLGHQEVWRFEDTLTKDRPKITALAPESALAAWSKAAETGTTGDRLAEIAAAAAKEIAADPAADPFFVRNAADEAALPEASRARIALARAELESHRNTAPPPTFFANAAQEGGVPESPHAGTHDVRVHMRGRYDKLGELVPRRFPTILDGRPSAGIKEGSGRRELAEWLTKPDNPLTARVIVNRLWQHHFGAGLVRTPSNFGKLGDAPSHPELLDRLAADLIKSGWSLKAMHRRIVLSAVYGQSSLASPEAPAHDADNRLLSRMNRRRLEAETIRDALLAVSGRLDATLGGPPVRDFAVPRRGLYVVTIRSDRATFGALFDQADSTAPVDHRVESTVAPQALFMLNNPFVAAQAKAFAERLVRESPDDTGRVLRSYEILYGRAPAADEQAVVLDLLAAGRKEGEPAEAAWLAPAQMLLCANEFLYVD